MSAHESRQGLSWTRRVMLGIALTALMGTSTGCNRYGWELFRVGAEIAAYAAVTAMVLSWHDRHQHGPYCGHRYVVHESRPVYDYDGRWEYYEAGTWYYYPDGVPGY